MSDDFSSYLRFFAVLCHDDAHFSHDHLSVKPVTDFTKFAISRRFSPLFAILEFLCERN